MNRMIAQSLIDKIKKLFTSLSTDDSDNVEIGNNLHVDGDLEVDGELGIYKHNITLSYGDNGDYTLSAPLAIDVISRDSGPYNNGSEIRNKLPNFNEIGSYTSQSGSGFVLFWSEDRSLPKAYKITIAGSTFTKVELSFRSINDSVTTL